MGGSSGSAPRQDPALGRAALLSAQTGRDALAFAQGQAEISNQWATEDRDRYNTVFRPVEDRFVRDSTTYDTAARRNTEQQRAQSDVRRQGAVSRGIGARNMASMGVNPRSGRYGEAMADANLNEGLAAVGAGNAARTAVIAEGRNRVAQAVNLGQGLAVNPGTSLGMGTAAGIGGFGAAQQGYSQQANILNAQHQNNVQAYEANQVAQGGLWGGLGSLAGTALSIWSSKDAKENKRPVRGALRAVESMPVESWDYKPGQGDGGRHVGPYAEDFKRETGKGDGQSIPVVDAIGTTMAAVQELSAKVDRLARPARGAMRRAA